MRFLRPNPSIRKPIHPLDEEDVRGSSYHRFSSEPATSSFRIKPELLPKILHSNQKKVRHMHPRCLFVTRVSCSSTHSQFNYY